MSRDLRRLGLKFVGRTICYAFMQAVGMVNDHAQGCFRYPSLGQPAPSGSRDRADAIRGRIEDRIDSR